MNKPAFSAGYWDFHVGVSVPRDRAYARGPLLTDWQMGWRRAVEEQESRHWELRGGRYVYVELPRHPLLMETVTNIHRTLISESTSGGVLTQEWALTPVQMRLYPETSPEWAR